MRKPRLLFVALANDIGSERLPMELQRNGIDCACLSPKGFYSSLPSSLSQRFRLPSHYGIWFGTLFVRPLLTKAISFFGPDLLIPLDDPAAWLLRGLGLDPSTAGPVRMLIEKSLGMPAGYSTACSRAKLMRVAQALDIRVPHHIEVTGTHVALAAARQWGYPIVLKQEHTCGGHGVTIVQSSKQLTEALDRTSTSRLRASMFASVRTAARMWVWNCAGFLLSGRHVSLQAHVPGRPAMCAVLARKGQVLESVSFVAERVHPIPTGSSTMIRHLEHDGMQEAITRLVAVLKCSGFVSFDFILNEDNDAYLIEMNPRAIGSVHLGGLFGHDLCAALTAWLTGEPYTRVTSKVRQDVVVALFPKELVRDPESFKAGVPSGMLHDVPWSEPAIVDAYLRHIRAVHPHHAESVERQTVQSDKLECRQKSERGPAVIMEDITGELR